jgi:uncharacterized SAM-binding protein YcdF (DUF218 family)
VPSLLAVMLVAAGLLVRLFPRTRAWSYRLVVAGFLVALPFSLAPVARALLNPLEQRFPAWNPDRDGALPIDDIVVLTAWSGKDDSLPATARLYDSGAARVITTVELWRRHPAARVIVSGTGRVVDDMSRALASLGIPATQLVPERQSRNTADSARQCSPLLAGRRFALVTSAGHLPRSMGAFAKAGLRPVAIPSDYRLPGILGVRAWIPSPRALAASDLAVHEYLALVWYRMRGRLAD